MKNLIVGVAAAAVLAAGALVFSSVKVSAKVEPYLDVYYGCTGPVIPGYLNGRTVGVCADRSIYQCSAHCDKVLEPDDPFGPIVGPDDRYPGDTFLPGEPAEYKKDEKDNWNRIK
ncbi:MAG: hypothetical protein J5498_03105 [Bacteroidales bacterium]|nr:hypothetical protein [Bacteroidales bacterium]MBR4409636.1 hypothetical protein [Bacteroidales bacterium]